MPRDTGTGIYSTPAGTDGIPNRTISSTAYNLNVHDVESDLNTARPIIAGGTGATDAATAVKNLGAMPKTGVGQCYLVKSGANLLLSQKDGNLIMINGNIALVPDSGVTLAPTSNAANTLYYIYAYMSAGTMTLEYSATAYATQAGTGVKIKNGDATRTLVGMWCSTGAATWSAVATEGVSYFNPLPKKSFLNDATTYITISTTSTSLTEIYSTYRNNFITFANRPVEFGIRGQVNVSANTVAAFLDVGIDSLTQQLIGPIVIRAYSPDIHFFSDSHVKYFSEARHYVTGLFAVASASTLSLDQGAWYATVLG